MSLMLAATEVGAGLSVKIRSRINEGAPVWETAVSEVPAWFKAELGGSAVQAIFQSEHAIVAVLENGGKVVRRIYR